MIKIILKIIATIIILNIVMFVYFKYKHPFWSRSPVMHYYTFKINEEHLFEKRDPYNEEVTKILDKNSVHYEEFCIITKNDMIINEKTKLTIDELKYYYTNWLSKYMS